MKFTTFVILCMALTVSSAYGKGLTVVHPKVALPQDRYMTGLLRKTLEASGRRFEMIEYEEEVPRSRLMELVSTGKLSLFWTGGSTQNDETFLPIRIPAYRGLMGHRVMIIRSGDQKRFDSVRTLADLQAIKLGQGFTWTDTKILTSAGFNIITAVKSNSLFYMLEGGRFDGFPRGVHEPWSEIERVPQLNLTVENNLVIKYLMPYYFYLEQSDNVLANAINEGFEVIINSGEFRRYFYADPEVRRSLERSRLAERRILEIDNPFVPKGAPVDRPELWLNIDEIQELSSY